MMDKIFKNIFENFEPEVPEGMFDKIMEQVHQEKFVVKPNRKAKFWLWGTVVVLVLLLSFFVWQYQTSTVLEPITEPQTVMAENQFDKTKATDKQVLDFEKESVKAVAKEDKGIAKEGLRTKPTTTIPKNTEVENKEPVSYSPIKDAQVQIFSERYTCHQTCTLKIEATEKGQWHSQPKVEIKNIDDVHFVAFHHREEPVLFTYQTANGCDTFTVFFRQASPIRTRITAADCNRNNGAILFETSDVVTLSLLDDYVFESNQISGLKSGVYNLELKDQYQCQYHIQAEVPARVVDIQIETDALHFTVGYPIYFKPKTDAEITACKWQFGDGGSSDFTETEHRFKTAGSYKVKLEISTENCPNQTAETLVNIDNKAIAIPNVFTPNNDGNNDLFFVSLPEETLRFEALVFSQTGQLVYQWNEADYGWDGRWQNGQEAKSDSYLLLLRVTNQQQQTFEYKNVIMLIR